MRRNEPRPKVDVVRAAREALAHKRQLTLANANGAIEMALISLGIGKPSKRIRLCHLILLIAAVDRGQALHHVDCALEPAGGFRELALIAKDDSDVLVAVSGFHAPLEIVGLDRSHAVGEKLIFAIRGFRFIGLPPPTRQVAEKEHVLRMVENPLRIIRRPAQRFVRSFHRGAEQARCGFKIAFVVRDFSHQGERPRTLGQALVGKLGCVLLVIVSEDPGADTVEYIQLANWLELILEVTEHKLHQSLGLAPLVACRIARLDRGNRQPAGDRHPGDRCGGEPGEATMALGRLALDQFVEPDAEHPRDQLEKAHPPAVAAVAQIGGERLGALARRAAAAVVFLAQRGREAFLVLAAGHVARERLPGGNRSQDAAVGTALLERVDFGIGPVRLRGVGRA